ncbi:MAG: MBL fold metallo-hydrolase [Caldilineaceae bacterium]|nr:MBL fold metallo-hydrolase [Caldilineaceae bacterium]HRJ44759.1 MBL fold metallo-hydrolase [Caldilineaceae bacterium]
MSYTLTVGGLRCHVISDGHQLSDGGGFFGLVPRVLWEPVIRPDERNRIPVALRSLLIESDAGLILVDTGQGDKLGEREYRRLGMSPRRERLIGEMRSLGFEPEDVATVLFTHLHGDHAGGATRWSEQENPASPLLPTFPNARYLVQRLELADATFPNERTRGTYFPQNWQPLQAAGVLDVVDGDQRLATGVGTETVPGHTGSIQAVWLENGGESLLFLGDTCSWAAHLERLAWVPAFDIYPMQSIEGKRRLRAKAQERESLLVFQHDGQVVTARLAAGERGPTVQPEIIEDGWGIVTGAG